jgi:hypothetical protein
VQALAAGMTTYQGAPCKRGHGSERGTADRECVECKTDPAVKARKAQQVRERYANNPAVRARQAEQQRKRRADPAVRERHLELNRKWGADPKNKARKAEQKRKYLTDPANRQRRAALHRKWYSKNKARVAERRRELRGDPEFKARQAKYKHERRADPTVRARQTEQQRKQHGVVLPTYPCPANCEMCGETFGSTRELSAVPDHCHVTGLSRGWIHNKCNRLIGAARDESETLRLGFNYLERKAREIAGAAEKGAAKLADRALRAQVEKRIRKL